MKALVALFVLAALVANAEIEAKFSCPKPFGHYPHENCWQYYQCVLSKAHQKTCPPMTQWNQSMSACVHSKSCQQPEPTATVHHLRQSNRPDFPPPPGYPLPPGYPHGPDFPPPPGYPLPPGYPHRPDFPPPPGYPLPPGYPHTPDFPHWPDFPPPPDYPHWPDFPPPPDYPHWPDWASFPCPEENGRYPHDHCWKYYLCSGWKSTVAHCPEGTQFDKKKKKCVKATDCLRPEFRCPETSGYFEHPNCWMFYQCGNGISYEITCPKSTEWRQDIKTCDHISECLRDDISVIGDDDEDGLVTSPPEPSDNISTDSQKGNETTTTASNNDDGENGDGENGSGSTTSASNNDGHHNGDDNENEDDDEDDDEDGLVTLPSDSSDNVITDSQKGNESTTTASNNDDGEDDDDENEDDDEDGLVTLPPKPSDIISSQNGSDSAITALNGNDFRGDFQCPDLFGHYPHPKCWMFYFCFSGHAFELACPSGTEWQQETKTCIQLKDCHRP